MQHKAWIDVITPKEALLFSRVSRGLEERGWDILVTTRDYEETVQLLEMEGLDYVKVGSHGETLVEKLRQSLYRMEKLAELVVRKRPGVVICLTSPDACRVAFGLKIPIICLHDTVHADKVARLTLPLSTYVVVPEAIPLNSVTKYGVNPGRVVRYRGVDAVAWIRDFNPSEGVLKELGLKRGEPIVVLRPLEEKSSYMLEAGGKAQVDVVVDEALRHGAKVVIFPRYGYQREYVRRKYGGNPNVVIPSRAVDSRSLMYYASLTVCQGGTMGIESALLGTPTVVYLPVGGLCISWLAGKGFPIYLTSGVDQLKLYVGRILENPRAYRVDTSRLLSQLEDPVEKIVRLAEVCVKGG